MRRIEDAAMHRALYGVEEQVHYHGEHVLTRRRYNERLVMFMLRNRAPDRFAAGGGARRLNALDQMELKRLKEQWRREWEAERMAIEDEEQRETLESIDRFIEDMRQRREANMSPRARAAYAEAARIHKEDGIDWMLDEIEAEEEDDDTPANPTAPALPLLAAPKDEPDPADTPPSGPRVRSIKGDWE